MDFLEAASMLGFTAAEDRRKKGHRTYTSRPNAFMTYWLHVYDDGTALLTWEFAIADYLLERGVQLGANESLNLFMYPAHDERGSQDPQWLTQALDRIEATLSSIDFAHPDG